MFQIFLHERLKPALSLNINYSESVGGILVFHSAVYSVTNLRFYFVCCEYFWSPKVMQCFFYLILCAYLFTSTHIPTSPAHFESCCQKHSDELLFSFDLNNVTRHVRQTVVTITKSECRCPAYL